MVRIENTRIFKAPVEVVFARLADPISAVEDIPSMVAARDIIGSGLGQQYKAVYKMAGLLIEINMLVIEHIENELHSWQISGGMSGTSTLKVKPHEGGTEVVHVVEFAIPIPVLRLVAEPFLARQLQREWRLVFENLQDALEGY